MPPSDPTDPRDPVGPDRDALELAAARAQPTGDADDGDLAALSRVGDVVRSLRDDDFLLDEPPPAVWAGIAAAVEADAAGRPGSDAGGRDVPGPAAHGRAGGTGAPPWSLPSTPPSPSPRPVTDLGGRRRAGLPTRGGWSGRAFIGIAAAVLLVVAIGVGALVGSGDPGPDVVASADLEPLELASGSTLAQLVDADGGLALDIPLDEAGLPSEAGYYEVWLIDQDIEGMVSLGPAREDGVYDLPPDVSYEDFPIVDVSLEPADGVPTHSGRSVLRGTLTTDA